MKALPWILVVIFLAAAGFLFQARNQSQSEIENLRHENAELPNLRAAIEDAKNAEARNGDAALNEKERSELIRLRNEVGQLRREKQQLGAQLQQATQKNEQLLQSQQNRQAQQIQQLQNQNQQLTQENAEQKTIQARNECINNLRQIDGAIQQWALENKQSANATVAIEQLASYFRNSKTPACPAGGVYSVTTVDSQPTCNMPGHSLQQ